ncbi:MAG: NTP transferase domain-containing protein [Candidatus Aenigmarchaeota archaeon]|nr:NTP transferase domain-containing protein [Candidatus Aenigmarchaeota archaeon]
MQAVILAAGLGTRLEPVTTTLSKPMVPVANKPFLEWLSSSLPCDDVALVIRKEQNDIIDYFSGNDRIQFVFQEKPLGTADALKRCKDVVRDRFLVANGDCYATQADLRRLSKAKNAVAVFESSNPKAFGSVSVENGNVTSIDEKSGSGSLVNAGFYSFDEGIFDAIEKTKLSKRNEYELTDAIMLHMQMHEIEAVPLSEWKTITYPWDILELNEAILKEKGSMISKTAEIRSGAVIEEPVAIGDGAVIGPNCFIRRHTSIGKGCKVGNAVEIKNSIVMDNSFVSHLSYVGDSIVGRNCNIGAGAIFANLRLDEKTVKMNIKGEKIDSGRKKLGALIGDNVKLGVNVTIMPGKKIYPNIMVPACHKVEHDLAEQPPLK